MDTKLIFSKRLKAARAVKGLSLAALCSAMGGVVSPQAICKYETGKMLPNSTILMKLSSALGVSLDYLFRPFTVEVTGIEFRRKSRLSVKDRRKIEGETMDRLERVIEIENICGMPDRICDINRITVSTVDQVTPFVQTIREQWEINDSGITNVISLLESKGVVVIEIPANEDFDGLSGYAGKIPVIVLNKKFCPERKRFTALHELGHLMMHFKDDVDDKDVERWCNLFASEMLIPRKVFMEKSSGLTFKGSLFISDFIDLQRKYGISIDALIYKLMSLNLISENRYRSYHIQKNMNEKFKAFAEKSRISDETSFRFEHLVLYAYSKALISISKAASMLDTSQEDVLQKSYVL